MNPVPAIAAPAERRGIVGLLFLLAALAGAAIAFGNGASRPMESHEIYVAQTASEMLQRGDYLVPRYKGEPRLKKPPLAYWLSVAAHGLIGAQHGGRVTELEARLPSLSAGILLLFVTFLLGAAAFDDRRVGLVAAAILATSWHFFAYTRNARPEMLYALFCSLQMLGVVVASRRVRDGRSGMPGAVLAWSAMAGALLAKGPQLPIFLMAGAVLALRLRRPKVALGQVLHPIAGIALIALILPYFAYLALQSDETVSLWAAQMLQDEPIPLWLRPLRLFYPWSVVEGFLPWTVALGLAAVHCWKRRHPNALLLAFGILVALFFLGFAGKLRDHYVLPLIPLCAVLAAHACVELLDRARADERLRRLVKWLVVAQAALIGGLLLSIAWLALREHPVTGLPMWPQTMPWLVAGALAASSACVLVLRRPVRAFGALVAALLIAWTGVATTGIDVSRRWATAAEFAIQVAQRIPEDTPVLFDSGEIAPLVYYGRRVIPRESLEEWLAAGEPQEPPLFICRRECLAEGYDVEGRVLIEQRALGRTDAMILFEIERLRPRALLSGPDPLAPAGHAAAETGSSIPA